MKTADLRLRIGMVLDNRFPLEEKNKSYSRY